MDFPEQEPATQNQGTAQVMLLQAVRLIQVGKGKLICLSISLLKHPERDAFIIIIMIINKER